jgi:hypothetical protein
MLAQEKRDKNALRPETEFLMLTGAASLMTDLMFVSSLPCANCSLKRIAVSGDGRTCSCT